MGKKERKAGIWGMFGNRYGANLPVVSKWIFLGVSVLICVNLVINWTFFSKNPDEEGSSLALYLKALVDGRRKVQNGFAPLSFEVCEGLSNQRISIIQGVLIASILRRPLIIPELYSSFNVSQSERLDFGDVYNVSHFKESLAGVVKFWDPEESIWTGKKKKMRVKNKQLTRAEWNNLTNGPSGRSDTAINLNCAFNSIRIDPSLIDVLWKIDRALVLQDEIKSKVDLIKKGMPNGFTALHYRVERDWVTHCQQWEGIADGVVRNNCLSNTAAIANVFAIEKVSQKRPIYLAGGLSPAFIGTSNLRFLQKHYKIFTKSSSLNMDGGSDDALHMGKKLVSNRELFAAIDYAVCSEADLFIGNSVSTFSAMIELRRMQENRLTFHYNGGNIPLQDYLPINTVAMHHRLKWVFAMVLNNQTDQGYLQMAKVAVISARENTLLEPVCVALVTDPSSTVATTFIRWLQSYGVHVIWHNPTWAGIIETEALKGNLLQNVGNSPLYAKASSLIATFLRIDLPILGFVDDYLLYADVDIMFVRDIDLDDFGPLPKYYLMCNEERITEPEKNPFAASYGNAGVMLYNVPNMRRTHKAFMEHIFSDFYKGKGLHYGDYGPGDQGAYNSFYKPSGPFSADIRPYAFFNWRPFWKGDTFDKKAVAIVHWHGPKPHHYADYLKDPKTVPESFHRLLSNCDRDNIADVCWQWNRLWKFLADTSHLTGSYHSRVN
jgi:hypothetical protein